MNQIQKAMHEVATEVCEVLHEIAKDDMDKDNMEIGDRLAQIKAALCMKMFLADEDADIGDLFPLIKDYREDWDSLDYFEFTEAFVKFIDERYCI
jgi:hypothetical protein